MTHHIRPFDSLAHDAAPHVHHLISCGHTHVAIRGAFEEDGTPYLYTVLPKPEHQQPTGRWEYVDAAEWLSIFMDTLSISSPQQVSL